MRASGPREDGDPLKLPRQGPQTQDLPAITPARTPRPSPLAPYSTVLHRQNQLKLNIDCGSGTVLQPSRLCESACPRPGQREGATGGGWGGMCAETNYFSPELWACPLFQLAQPSEQKLQFVRPQGKSGSCT